MSKKKRRKITPTPQPEGSYRIRVPAWGGRSAMLAWSLLILAVALITIALWKVSTSKTQQPASAFVDTAACASCHQQEASTYAQTGMGRSFSAPRADAGFGDFDRDNTLRHDVSHRSYRMIRRDGRWFERREADSGEADEDQIDYIIGSGNHARTFLHRTPGGRLIELPVSWYQERGGYWAMSPGYDNASQKDFGRAIGYDCMFCHNGYPDLTEQTEAFSRQGVWKGKLATGIDCQRCHGPGAKHVQVASTAGSSLQQVRASIVNPAHLDRDRQMSVCMQCHLETTSLRLPNSIQHFDRKPFSFEAGELLADDTSYFDHAPNKGFDDRFEVAHQAYRLEKSACFRSSEMTCTTCHNPHLALRGAEAVQHFTAVCASCHSNVHPQILAKTKSSCLDCHMPKRRTEDAVHVVVTDHYIQRKPAEHDPAQPIPEIVPDYRGEVVDYHATSGLKNSGSADQELYLAAGQVQQDSNLIAGLPQLRKVLDRSSPHDPRFDFILGAGYERAGNHEAAIQALQQALRVRSDFTPALRELSIAYERSGNVTEAIRYAEESIRSADDLESLHNVADIYLQSGRPSEATRILQRALATEPEDAESNNMLGIALIQMQQFDAADAALRRALNANPDLDQARTNLANLMASRSNFGGAKELLERRLRVEPRSAPLSESYGAVLFASGDAPGAVAYLRKAIQNSPAEMKLHIVLGDLFVASGQDAAAVPEYRAALRSRSAQVPVQIQAHTGLASALANLHKTSEAEAEFREAIRIDSKNGEAHLGLAQLLSELGRRDEARQHLAIVTTTSDPSLKQKAVELSSHLAQ